ncbi:MAG: helix-turn-helix domain-containing protein [Planctomycetes bacterium]|nr:helix-turn-helix domain-containing protein [Planctomycetota bacterium]
MKSKARSGHAKKGPKLELKVDAKQARKMGIDAESKGPPKTLSPNQAGRVLGVTGEAVKRWIYDRRLPATKLTNGYWRIKVDDLERFIKCRVSAPKTRVLIYSSDPATLESLSSIVAHEERELLVAGSLLDALLKCQDVYPNMMLITMDGDAQGWKLIERIRQAAHVRPASVLLFSTKELSEADLDRALELNVQGYLRLPVDKDALLMELERLSRGNT